MGNGGVLVYSNVPGTHISIATHTDLVYHKPWNRWKRSSKSFHYKIKLHLLDLLMCHV
jgi:hypothetical protein